MSNVGESRYTLPRNNSSNSGQSYTTSNESCHADVSEAVRAKMLVNIPTFTIHEASTVCFIFLPYNFREKMSVAFFGKLTDYRLNVLVTQGSYCSTFEWVDQPGCQRCVEVIPGLIWCLSRSTANEKAYEDRIRKLEAHVHSLRARLYVVLITVVVTYMRWFASRRTPS
ncbi:hypothetical protein Salat_0676400 [Sesamum alatum]|uniref:Uncharacterized protein n=1 Tax=Sesamum alatum TaxID=300844 RepID=A0AAE1YS04_9LAMI|nr:hypothetical protein Salat_0676400 [Sesamum alatum]